jgi:hypothetical protein
VKVDSVSSSTRNFATGSPLSAAYRIVFAITSGAVSRLLYLDVFAQANDRDLTETLLLTAMPPAARSSITSPAC